MPGKGACPDESGPPVLHAVFSRRFLLLWLVFFCNITAGIAIISFQSPLFQDLWKRVNGSLAPVVLAGLGATLVAVSSLFNGAGRFAWGAFSDRIGRAQTFRIMLGSQILVFLLLILTGSPWVFAVLVCWVLLCYGGGFGTMPSSICDVFGAGLMSAVYGVVLTAWAAAGVVGPQIFAAFQDRMDPATASRWSFIVAGGFAVVGLVLSFLLTNEPAAAEAAAQKAAARRTSAPARSPATAPARPSVRSSALKAAGKPAAAPRKKRASGRG